MKEPIVKKKAGQSGSSDNNIYVRQDRLEIRVSHKEKESIVRNSAASGFDTTAQYIRCQAVRPGSESPNTLRQAYLMCQYQLNRLGNNINQIARAFNSGNQIDNDALLALREIQNHAEALVKEARNGLRPSGSEPWQ